MISSGIFSGTLLQGSADLAMMLSSLVLFAISVVYLHLEVDLDKTNSLTQKTRSDVAVSIDNKRH